MAVDITQVGGGHYDSDNFYVLDTEGSYYEGFYYDPPVIHLTPLGYGWLAPGQCVRGWVIFSVRAEAVLASVGVDAGQGQFIVIADLTRGR